MSGGGYGGGFQGPGGYGGQSFGGYNPGSGGYNPAYGKIGYQSGFSYQPPINVAQGFQPMGRQAFNGAQWSPQAQSMGLSQPAVNYAAPWAKGFGDGPPPVGGGGTTPPGVPGGTSPPGTGPGGYTPPVTPPVTPPTQPTSPPPPTSGRPGDFGVMPDNGRWWGSGPGPYPGGQPGMGNSPTNTAPMQAGQNSWGWMGPNNYTPMFNPSEKLYIQQMQNYGTGGNGPPAWWNQVDPNNMVSSIGQLSGVKFDPSSALWKV